MRTTPSRMTATAPRLRRGDLYPPQGLRKTPPQWSAATGTPVSQDSPKSEAQVSGRNETEAHRAQSRGPGRRMELQHRPSLCRAPTITKRAGRTDSAAMRSRSSIRRERFHARLESNKGKGKKKEDGIPSPRDAFMTRPLSGGGPLGWGGNRTVCLILRRQNASLSRSALAAGAGKSAFFPAPFTGTEVLQTSNPSVYNR